METREVFWNISSRGELLFYLLTGITLVFLGYGIYSNVKRILQGKALATHETLSPRKVVETLWLLATNRSVLRHDGLAGVMHLLIMWGFIVLFIGTVIVAIEYDLFQKILGLEHGFWIGQFYLGYKLVLNALGALFIMGLTLALLRRYGLKLPHLSWKPLDLLLPVWLLAIAVTGFFVEALRIAATKPAHESWSFVGYSLAQIFWGWPSSRLQSAHLVLWWVHGLLALSWIAYLPYAPKVMHILSAAANVLLRDLYPLGRLMPLDVEGAFERGETLGLQRAKDLTWKDTLDLLSCTECGRCEANCPAWISGKALSPRNIILELRGHVQDEVPPIWHRAQAPQDLVPASVSPEELWACTTCRACVEVCPVYIDPLNKILEMRRNEVMMKDQYPAYFTDVFKGFDGRGNPWNITADVRLEWTKGLNVPIMSQLVEAGTSNDIEYLFFVGCATAFEPRNHKIARSLVKVLKHAGIKFAILGEEETCTGDPARRIGHEYLFQIQAHKLIKTFSKYGVRKILTVCPHCYNTFKNEHPDFGGRYEVIHHSELIAQLLKEGKIKLTKEMQKTITYHDSCYLGRYNRVYDPPREAIDAIPGIRCVEMRGFRERGLCCGAGGGLMWLEEEPDKRVNDLRLKQVLEAKADIVATACPFCMIMLEDGIKTKNLPLEDKDIAELVMEAMGSEG